jgi:hypothetical protein
MWSSTGGNLLAGPTATSETGPDVDEDCDATNFSFVSWGEIAGPISLKVDTRLSNDLRFG